MTTTESQQVQYSMRKGLVFVPHVVWQYTYFTAAQLWSMGWLSVLLSLYIPFHWKYPALGWTLFVNDNINWSWQNLQKTLSCSPHLKGRIFFCALFMHCLCFFGFVVYLSCRDGGGWMQKGRRDLRGKLGSGDLINGPSE